MNKVRVIFLLILIVAIITATILLFKAEHVVTVIVQDKSWIRQIVVENYLPRAEATWCSSKPDDAYNVVISAKKSGSSNIKVGTITIRRDSYSDWCDYTVDRWEQSRVTETQGKNDNPYWGNPDVDNCTAIGCTRESNRIEHYIILLVSVADKNGSWECEYPQPIWSDIPLNQEGKISISSLQNIPHCEDFFRN